MGQFIDEQGAVVTLIVSADGQFDMRIIEFVISIERRNSLVATREEEGERTSISKVSIESRRSLVHLRSEIEDEVECQWSFRSYGEG